MMYALIFILAAYTLQAQVSNFDVRGNWVGSINAGVNIELIFKVTGINDLSCSLDVPLQGAKDIPASLQESIQSVKFYVNSINGHFDGKKIDSVTLEGNWKQNGGMYPITLIKKNVKIEPPKRPQTPFAPFP